jgi:zinc protease
MRFHRSIVLLLLLQSPPAQPKPIEYREVSLPNGLKIVTHEDHSTPVINLQVWYHVGSKDEKPGRTGFAHLFEHLMFKGSAHIKPEEHDKIITNAGGVSNAYTEDDVTVSDLDGSGSNDDPRCFRRQLQV